MFRHLDGENDNYFARSSTALGCKRLARTIVDELYRYTYVHKLLEDNHRAMFCPSMQYLPSHASLWDFLLVVELCLPTLLFPAMQTSTLASPQIVLTRCKWPSVLICSYFSPACSSLFHIIILQPPDQ
jgi:hypothetical protein